ncbi:transcriptional regulator [Nesterenkonia lutea]|uniref:DNA-binding MarR family transcriptional regulator n=1 Tax=Nesterenkonia lutea TaxID=272919 RepID=A0ABR9JEJ6_9MICC|nr:transcriptional regulator [Nesterenkonia lutea]MBE1524358.1 DNA-binding MarR family transcriptional regulator [Nesterenkonia lutea]
MPEAAFDETIHAPVRLRICGLLRPVDHLDFAVLRDTLEVSDATLSKHLKTLAGAGYVSSSKAASAGRGDARQITWLSLTRAGRSAFSAHLQALREIAGSSAGLSTFDQ